MRLGQHDGRRGDVAVAVEQLAEDQQRITQALGVGAVAEHLDRLAHLGERDRRSRDPGIAEGVPHRGRGAATWATRRPRPAVHPRASGPPADSRCVGARPRPARSSTRAPRWRRRARCTSRARREGWRAPPQIRARHTSAVLATETLTGVVTHRQVPLRVAIADGVGLAGVGEALTPVLPERLQLRVAHVARLVELGDDQRLVDEPAEQVEDVGADRASSSAHTDFDGVEAAAPREHREPSRTAAVRRRTTGRGSSRRPPAASGGGPTPCGSHP